MLKRDHSIRRRLLGGVVALALTGGSSSAIAQGGPLPPTESTSIGIYYVPDAPQTRNLWRDGDPGERLQLRGRVLDTDGAPVADAQVELWHADGRGQVHPDRYRTRLFTRADGSFGVTTALPGYIPGAPGVWGARHIHVVVSHPAYAELVSLILFKDDPNLAALPEPYPALAVFAEQGRIKDQTVQFAEVILVLRR